MKLKKILAGALAAAMVVTSLPIPWLGNAEVRAAEEEDTSYVDVPIKMGAAESQEMTGEGDNNGWAKYAVDGNNDTFWHSAYNSNPQPSFSDGTNNSYFIALEKASTVDKITYLPRQRQGGGANGTILKCEIAVTTDELADMPTLDDITDESSAEAKNNEAIDIFTAESVVWETVAITAFDTAEWANDNDLKEILFEASKENVTGIKVTAIKSGSVDGRPDRFISGAEFGVKAIEKEEPRIPDYEDVKIKMGAAESQEMTGEGNGANGWAKYAVDGSINTFWHSKYSGGNNVTMADNVNNSYFIALEEASSVDKVTYTPRQNDGKDVNGTVLKCEVSVTTDALEGMPSIADITDQSSATAKNDEAIGIFKAESVTWKPVAITTFDTADWAKDEAEKEILFGATEKDVTGIKITITKTGSASGTQDNQFICGSEFGVKAEVPPTYKDVEIQMGIAESQELTGEGASNGWAKYAVDGNPNTFWHSCWNIAAKTDVDMENDVNNSYYIALKNPSAVDRITYLPRTGTSAGGSNGTILKCEIYVTRDELADMPSISDIDAAANAETVNKTALDIVKAEGVKWQKVGEATWENNRLEKEFAFPSTKKRVTGIKITVKEGVSDSVENGFISAGEFGVQVIDDSEPDPIIPEPTYVKADIKMGAAESQELTGESNGANGWAKYAVDGDENTYWHSKYSGGNNVNIANGENNSFYIALKKASSVDKITYVPRRANANVNGTILNCEVYVTTDRLPGMPSLEDITNADSSNLANNDAMEVFTSEDVAWKKVDIKTFDEGNWAYDDAEKAILFDATEEKVTGIKITAKATGAPAVYPQNMDKFISAAEFTVYGKEVPPEPEFVNETIKMGAAESQEMSGESQGANGWAVYAVDGKDATYWHSNYNPNDVDIAGGVNNSYYIALEKATSVDKLTYLPRQTQGVHVNGTILNCDVFVTTDELAGMPSVGDISDRTSASEKNAEALAIFKADNVTWKQVETASFDEGNWAYDQNAKEIVFKTKERNVTGIKITAKATGAQSDTQNDMFISGAEFGVIRRTIEDETPASAMDELADTVTPAMGRIVESGNVSGTEQVYTTASYRRFEAAYAKAASLLALTDLSNVSVEEIKAAKDALEDSYRRLIQTSDVSLITARPDVTLVAPVVGQAPADAELTGETLDTNADVDIERLEFDEEGGITGKITAPNDRNSVFNVTGDTKFLIHFEMKTAPVSNVQSIIGKMNEQYGLQITSAQLQLFGKTTGDWLEVDCPIPSEEGWYDEWHDVVGIFNGEQFELYLDGVEGTIPSSHAGRSGQLVESPISVFSIFYNATESNQDFGGKLRDISMYIGEQVPEYTIGEEDTPEDVMDMFKTALEGREKSFELNAKAAEQQRGYSVKSTTWTPAASAFERYQDYTVEVVLQADRNHEFKEDATALVRVGATNVLPAEDVEITVDGDQMTIRYTFEGEEFPKVTLSKYLNSAQIQETGWKNKDANGVRKYTAASWSAYLSAFNAASVANGSASLSAEDYIKVIGDLQNAVAGLKLAAENCECDLVEVTDFADAEIKLGMSAERTVTLGGDCKHTNDCLVHPSAEITKRYALAGNTAGATLTGNELKVTQAGTVQVRLTVGLGTQTKTATATFTVTSRRPTDAQKEALASAIANVEQNYAPNKEKYTAVSWRAVTDALENAKKFGETATTDRIGAYEKAITDALANLVIRDKKLLEDLISEVSGLKADDYTADSWNKVKTAYDSAAALISSETAAIDDYAKAYNELAAAKAALITKAAELEAANKELTAALAAAAPVYNAGQQNYSDDTWKAFADAYTAANAAAANTDAASINTLAASLKNAQAALAVAPLQAGATATIGKIRYKVVNAEKKTAMVVKGTNNKQKTVKIPATVEINGVDCKVVQIGSKAFNGYKSMTKVTIGKNVATIGQSAFRNCNKLKNVVVNGTALKNIKAKAFAKTASKVTVKASSFAKGKKNALLKKMTDAGMSKKATIK